MHHGSCFCLRFDGNSLGHTESNCAYMSAAGALTNYSLPKAFPDGSKAANKSNPATQQQRTRTLPLPPVHSSIGPAAVFGTQKQDASSRLPAHAAQTSKQSQKAQQQSEHVQAPQCTQHLTTLVVSFDGSCMQQPAFTLQQACKSHGMQRMTAAATDHFLTVCLSLLHRPTAPAQHPAARI